MIPLNPFAYFSFFDDYFASRVALLVILLGVGSIVVLFTLFKSSRNSVTRSRTLLSILGISGGLWIFVLSSLAFCIMLVNLYWAAPEQAISLVSKIALSFSVVLMPTGIFLLRGRAAREASMIFFPNRKASPQDKNSSLVSQERIARIFSSLNSKIWSPRNGPVQVQVLPSSTERNAPFSGALDWNGSKVVAITENVVESLDDDELQAVLAHELAHIKYRDAVKKTVATAYRLAFQFDPLSRFVEAAIYRERELAADEFAARSTKKPEALASALLKVYGLGQFVRKFEFPMLSTLSLTKSSQSALSKQPSLKLRIERLLEMTETRDIEIPASQSDHGNQAEHKSVPV